MGCSSNDYESNVDYPDDVMDLSTSQFKDKILLAEESLKRMCKKYRLMSTILAIPQIYSFIVAFYVIFGGRNTPIATQTWLFAVCTIVTAFFVQNNYEFANRFIEPKNRPKGLYLSYVVVGFIDIINLTYRLWEQNYVITLLLCLMTVVMIAFMLYDIRCDWRYYITMRRKEIKMAMAVRYIMGPDEWGEYQKIYRSLRKNRDLQLGEMDEEVSKWSI